jgi:hypothetical protein
MDLGILKSNREICGLCATAEVPCGGQRRHRFVVMPKETRDLQLSPLCNSGGAAMKVLLPLAALLALSVSSASADDGQIPRHSLARMGLGHLQVLSDAEGAQVRGEFAFTYSRARVGNTTRSQVRVGSNFAFSSRIVIGGGTVAGGGAFAVAH